MPQADTWAPAHEQPAPPTLGETSPVLALPIIEMARFRRLMQYEGWEVDLPRMCVDTDYAYACLATAHTSSDERLRKSALRLFESYDRNSAPGAMH